MPTPLVSLCWKEHSCQLAALCKNLLVEDFLVDCTIAAEGQKLKAHRLILSACSPYFQMLFSEDAEKHPIIFLKDTLFDTLKAVIDFIYGGEIQIPADKLEAFLALSESLQIKGLHNSRPKDRNKNLCPYVIGNVVHSLPKDNQSSSGLQGTSGVSDLSAEISSQQHHPHLYTTGRHRDAVRSESSASCEEYNEFYEDVRSASMVTPLYERQIVPGCDDQALDADIAVKNEQLHSLQLETNSEVLGNIENSEHMSGNYGSEINEGTTPAFGDQGLNDFSSGIVDLASVMPPQQQQVMLFPHEGCSGLHPAKEHEPMDSVLLVPKNEEIDDAEREESMNVHCTPENDTNEGTHLAFCEPNLNQCSNAVETLAARPAPRLGREGRPRKTQTHSPPDKQPHRSSAHADTSSGSSPAHRKNTHPDERSYPCDLCGASFRLQDTLKDHKRRHKTDRPFLWDCGTSAQSSRLETLLRTHTRERPFRCDICGTSFLQSSDLKAHRRTHTGERPFRCDICEASFAQLTNLKCHKRTHTGERPFRCDVCDASFARSTTLRIHKRTHTGERPFRCHICGASFTRSNYLKNHMRTHLGK